MSDRQNKILLAFYGDDFTGSSDALEFLSRAGARTLLFIEPPSPEKLAQYPGLDAFGVAGMTRSMTPPDMERVLSNAFSMLKACGARHVHYKICSTFDSSPQIGSIGKAIDTGATVFGSKCVPLLVAAPALGRYTAFGNLFARMGIGSNGEIYRLDRHPSMSRHPVTPASESDLRVHLSKQTMRKTALLDILQIMQPLETMIEAYDKAQADGNEIVLIDAMYESQLEQIGRLLDAVAEGSSLFSVGSSGIEMSLGKFWQAEGVLRPRNFPEHPGDAGPLLVISGSCSVVSARQITHSLSNGFKEVPIDTAAIAQSGDPSAGLLRYAEAASAFIRQGYSVIVHSSSAGDDPRVAEATAIFRKQGLSPTAISEQTAKLFGTALGLIAREVSARVAPRRMVIAGGDTSGYAARAMGIEAVEMIAGMSPGAPLCKAHAPGSPVNGIELTIKGGQVGGEEYFVMVRG